ncbi:MAG TPA: hypothetical protein VFM25_13625, partial [Verrucomicrobiae bacterium]|nr:hypothetical protein [Verrucomicrobiae bacterium]
KPRERSTRDETRTGAETSGPNQTIDSHLLCFLRLLLFMFGLLRFRPGVEKRGLFMDYLVVSAFAVKL